FKKSHAVGQPEILASLMFQDLAMAGQKSRNRAYQANGPELTNAYNLYYNDHALNQFLSQMAVYIDHIFPRSADMMLAPLNDKQKKFLLNEFKELVISREEEEFYSVEKTDSLEKAEERYTEQFAKFAEGIDKDPILQAGSECLKKVLLEVKSFQTLLKSGSMSPSKIIQSAGFMPQNADLSNYLGSQPGWAVGGPDNDYYTGDYKFILDFGGDDVYDLSYDENNPHGVIIIDMSGNDSYRSLSNFTLGSGCMSVGLLIDLDGNDRYDAKSFGIGSGYFGYGVLYDAKGDDRYDGDTHVQGAASFGIGLLIDEQGRDSYNAALFAQGFGFVEGFGLIQDGKGSDTYYAGGKYKDILRYEDHYLSLSQGFGYGLRPLLSGGIGGIVDADGNDLYYSDIFGQGSSYWWAMGFILDQKGNDNYQSFQYAQGSAAHMSLGIVLDESGNDIYSSKGVSQGCGHDFSAGILLDRNGDDTYSAYDLSQAAGSANGVGILIDNGGSDRYSIFDRTNSQGYGNPRREYGSIGLFMDLGGQDLYLGNGQDNFFWRTNSKWGAGMDIELNPAQMAESGK
ncbi:MAG: hypothetical protein ACREBV_03510, partial [Candidatus Zixiibacteriota bacterium]